MLEGHKLNALPRTFYYIPEFITPEEEDFLWKHIYNAPIPKWVVLKARRLQNWGGIPHPKGMLTEKIPNWLQPFMDRVSSLGIFGENKANHALVNEYLPGQGIFPHHDGPLYYPAVSTINLGSYGVLDFYKPVQDDADEERYIGSVLLEPRSLNIVTDELYTYYMHGIAEASTDQTSLGPRTRETRISVTIRHVPVVSRLDVRTLLKKS
ncbi:unnamed protein product [Echinostoma caproni]|uniref:Fe2OG dioxygenase domain-containing protein n=1 Tax=Echinostoma caproni TaxID=27848 RepID=A0A183B463_9TREM|nr:unnamed protein product [Echinostoma caproni]